MKNNTIINIAAIAAGVYLISRVFKKPSISTTQPLKNGTSGTMDTGFMNAVGKLNPFAKKGPAQKQLQTKCASNLERLGSLYPNSDQYNAELGKAYQREGSNFSNWAKAEAKPCFVVGADQGGLQSGGIGFDASVSNDGAFKKGYFNFDATVAGDGAFKKSDFNFVPFVSMDGAFKKSNFNFDGSVAKDGAFNKSYFNAYGDERKDGDMRVFNAIGAGMF